MILVGDGMFSNIDIMRAIKDKSLIIDPFDPSMLKPNAVSLRLDNQIAVAKGGKIDPLSNKDVKRNYKIVKLGKGKKYLFKPGGFILARTLERVALSEKIAMLVEGRSTLARLGISVTQTAMVIEAGHGFPSKNKARPRKIVLEISNSGPFSVYLTPGMKIAKGTISRLETPTDLPYDSYGRYGKEDVLDSLFPILDGKA